jgi:hypothetical protein
MSNYLPYSYSYGNNMNGNGNGYVYDPAAFTPTGSHNGASSYDYQYQYATTALYNNQAYHSLPMVAYNSNNNRNAPSLVEKYWRDDALVERDVKHQDYSITLHNMVPKEAPLPICTAYYERTIQAIEASSKPFLWKIELILRRFEKMVPGVKAIANLSISDINGYANDCWVLSDLLFFPQNISAGPLNPTTTGNGDYDNATRTNAHWGQIRSTFLILWNSDPLTSLIVTWYLRKHGIPYWQRVKT